MVEFLVLTACLVTKETEVKQDCLVIKACPVQLDSREFKEMRDFLGRLDQKVSLAMQVEKVKKEHQDPGGNQVWMDFLENLAFLGKMVFEDSLEHPGQVESKVARAREAFPDYLGMWCRKKV